MTKAKAHQHNREDNLPPKIDAVELGLVVSENEEPVKGRADISRRDAYDVDFS
jgi:hypothetical protein